MPEKNSSWFGGSLMGAVGLNGATAQASHPRERAQQGEQQRPQWLVRNQLSRVRG